MPLIVYQAPSLSRSTGVQALEDAGIAYRVTCTVRGVNGVLAAVRAGMGIAIFARSLVPEDLVELPVSSGLPELGEIDLILLTNPRAATGAVVGAVTGGLSVGLGAGIGAGIGALGGLIVDQKKKGNIDW